MSMEQVPFRLTPNFRSYMTDVGLSGLFVSTMTATGICLTEAKVLLSLRERGMCTFVCANRAWHVSCLCVWPVCLSVVCCVCAYV